LADSESCSIARSCGVNGPWLRIFAHKGAASLTTQIKVLRIPAAWAARGLDSACQSQ